MSMAVTNDVVTKSFVDPHVDPDGLIRNHANLVRKIATRVYWHVSSAIEMDDLVQIGMVALIEAARHFEDRGEALFATYAGVRVRGAMIDRLRAIARISRCGIRKRREFAALRARLQVELGRTPNDDDMARGAKLTLKAYHVGVSEAQTLGMESLDGAVADHCRNLADDQPSAFDRLHEKEMSSAMTTAMAALNERDALVLRLFFTEELNLKEIGRIIDVSGPRVCQIKKEALSRLRHKLGTWSAPGQLN